MPNEIVEFERDGEIIEMEVPAGTTATDIESFLTFNKEQDRSFTDALAAKTAKPLATGAAAILDLPVTLANAASAGINAVDSRIAKALGNEPAPSHGNPPQLVTPFTEAGQRVGIIPTPEDRESGVTARFFEFMGASGIPFGASVHYGSKALQSLSTVPSVLQQMGRATASNPGKATAWDVGSNFSAAAGGEVARGFTDNEAVIAMAEFTAGFTPTAATLIVAHAPGSKLAQSFKGAVTETLAPFTEAGARPKAARRLQDVAGDPEAAAAAIDPNSPFPPAIQSGDPNLIKLQNLILKKFPKLEKKFTEELTLSIQALQSDLDFGGDIERAAHLLNIRQQIAVEEAADAVAKLGSNATPRQISRTAVRSVQRSLDDATTIEGALWKSLDKDAPADIVTARGVLNEEIAGRSLDADPADIPKWLQAKLGGSPIDQKLLAGLEKQGLVSVDGVIDPAIMAALERQGALKTRQRTLDDLITIRSRVLREMRAEKSLDAPNRNKIRILNDVQGALLDDMSATGVAGVDDARAFSAAVNERYRQGRMGRLLGFDKTGAERVAEEDFLDEVVFGTRSASTTQRLVEATSESPEQVLSYIKARYVEAVDGSPNAHNTFVKNLEKKGMFELFPELKAELVAVKGKQDAALRLQVPESQVNTTRINKDQSRAALLLQANPGEEMKMILKSNNPVAAVRDAMKIVMKDLRAVNGMKTAFAQEVFEKSGGNGESMIRMLGEYKPVMRAMHMNDAEINRLNTVAKKLRSTQVQPGISEIGTGVLDEPLLAPIDLLARYAGARAGGQMGNSMGSGLVMAQFWSKATRERVSRLTTSKAEDLLVEAISDPELFRALLTSPTAGMAQQKRAAKTIEAIIMRSESAGRRALAVAATEDEE